VKLYGWDTETWCFWPGNMAPPLVCSSLARARPGTERVLDRHRSRVWLRSAFARADVHLVGHNIAYDLGVACADQPELLPLVFAALEAGRLHDTGIRESLMDLARGSFGVDPRTGRAIDADEEGASYPLTVLVSRYLGASNAEAAVAEKHGPDAWRLRYRELDGMPVYRWPPSARAYPKHDARNTIDVYLGQEKQARTLPNGGNLNDEARSVHNAFALHLVTLRGLRTDGSKIEALEAEVERKHLEAERKFRQVGIIRPDGTENKKRIQELVSAAYAGDPPRAPKGGIATDRDTKIESGDALLIDHGTSGKNNKYRTTYIPKIRQGATVPINPRFYGMAATTRVTSDYQQLPQKGGIRECHVARPGFVFCSVDYEGLELRTMAQRAIWHPDVGYSRMGESLLKGLDVHTVAAGEFVGATYEELLPRVKAKDNVATSMRALAKVFNFGKGGGMGAKTLAYHARAKDGVRFCLLAKRLQKCGSEGFEAIVARGQEKRVCSACIQVAKELDGRWLAAWPEQKELFAIASRLHRNDRKSEVMIPGANVLRAGCGYTQWLNTPFQGMGAVLTTQAMRKISREMYCERSSPLWGSRLVLNVHDELIAEIRTNDGPERMHDAAERMAFLMCESARALLPDMAPAVKAEPALSRILSKDAGTVRDAQGRLRVWEPTKPIP
jgi:DNA polymerase-1